MQAAAAVVALGALAAPPGFAALAGSGDVRTDGACTKRSSIELKLSDEDGGVEVEVEVDENRSGSTWKVRILRNGATVFRGKRTTHAPSGSFTVRRVVSASGASRFSARATSPSGEVCKVAAAFTPGSQAGDDGSGAGTTSGDDSGGTGDTSGGDTTGGSGGGGYGDGGPGGGYGPQPY